MSKEPQDRLIHLLAEVVEKPPAERGAFLDRVCGSDDVLRRRLQTLLAAHESAGAFLPEEPRTPAASGVQEDQSPTLQLPFEEVQTRREGPGSMIGRYKLLQQIGEGGCGTVFMAEQEEPVRRRVALKVIKLGMDTKSVVARFEAERQALAMMDHPNIARVFDAGATSSGRPYFVMELVRGLPITRYCDDHRLDTRQRLDLFIQVCHAIQHAHQKGIIHRDIKPSNILVTLNDGVAVPKVIDFGIAKATLGKLTDQTLFTAFEQFIGTPAYMSPEQAGMTSLDIDTRSDIYSLGVLLYELLTGKTPFDSKELAKVGIDAIRRMIREIDPPRPSNRLSSMVGDALTTTAQARGTEGVRLMTLIQGDLDWIVMKCLEKNRSRRYETANSLAGDLLRHLQHEPVIARPPSTIYQLGKALRRHRIFFISTGAVALALILGVIVSITQAVRARRAERVALTEGRRKTQVTDFLRQMFESVNPAVAQGRPDPVLRSILDQASTRVFDSLASQPEVAMELVQTIGRTYSAIGEYEPAEHFQREVVRALEGAKGSESIELAQALLELAGTRRRQGGDGISEAKTILARAANIAHHRGNSVVEAEVMMETAFIDMKTGELTEAERLTQKAVANFSVALGPQAPASLAAGTRIAQIQFSMGRSSNAIATAQRILSIQQASLGSKSPDTLATQFILAAALQNEGRYAEATRNATECYENRKRVLGESHPSTLATMDELAILLSYQGQFAKAEQICRTALAIHLKQLGAGHGDTLGIQGNLAEYLRNQNRFAESEAVFQTVLAAYPKDSAANNPDRLETLYGLALLYQFAGRHPDAEKLAGEIITIRRLNPANSSALADALSLLTTSLLAQGKFAPAASSAQEALTLREADSPGAWSRYSAEGQLGLSLAGLGKWTEAEPLLRNAYQNLLAREATIPAIERVRIAEILRGLIQTVESQGTRPNAAWVSELVGRDARAKIHDRSDL
jgi:serine/threonine protein kinase/tetratricopeptide (TPR) repeat protein